MKRFLLIAVLLSLAVPVAASELTGFRFRQTPDKLRVVFDSDAQVRYELLVLEDPHRIVVDFESSSALPSFERDRQDAEFGDTALIAVRSAPRQGADYRVVLDLRESMNPNHFTLAPAGPYGHRLVIDLTGSGQSQIKIAPQPPLEGELRDVLIAVDAGHGGEDPGTPGIGKIPEKDIVLAIARRLHRLINATEGFKSILIRDGDYLRGLHKRIEFAREHRAHVFVSIHADGALNKSARGASVYTLSEKGASSEEARRLANLENNSDLISGVSEIDLREKDDMLAQVLLDMSMEAKRVRSIALAQAVIKEMGKVTRLRPHPHGEAGFRVLKAPDLPSILVETGFLTNVSDYELLANGAHQEKLAKAILRGVANYVHSDPPPGTHAAAATLSTGIEYKIRRGDTLSGVAQRFSVSAASLRGANGLTSDKIRVGQVLKIPNS